MGIGFIILASACTGKIGTKMKTPKTNMEAKIHQKCIQIEYMNGCNMETNFCRNTYQYNTIISWFVHQKQLRHAVGEHKIT
jgi:hypothetical protein